MEVAEASFSREVRHTAYSRMRTLGIAFVKNEIKLFLFFSKTRLNIQKCLDKTNLFIIVSPCAIDHKLSRSYKDYEIVEVQLHALLILALADGVRPALRSGLFTTKSSCHKLDSGPKAGFGQSGENFLPVPGIEPWPSIFRLQFTLTYLLCENIKVKIQTRKSLSEL